MVAPSRHEPPAALAGGTIGKEADSMDQGAKGSTAGVTSFNTRLFERMRGMHRAWIEKAREVRRLELDYGSRLMAAQTPSHAVSLCDEWMAKRMAIIAQEQEMFANSWVWLLADTIGAPSAGLAKVWERDQ
jgi:hypothetical protein